MYTDDTPPEPCLECERLQTGTDKEALSEDGNMITWKDRRHRRRSISTTTLVKR